MSNYKWRRIGDGVYGLLLDGVRIGVVERSRGVPIWYWAIWSGGSGFAPYLKRAKAAAIHTHRMRAGATVRGA